MNPNPLSSNSEPMAFKDAAIVALVATAVLLGVIFYPAHTYDLMRADPARFVYDLIWFVFGTWSAEFGTLTGIMAYVKYKQPSEAQGSG